MINLWKRFESLLPTDPLLIATVVAHNADGTSTVAWPGGGHSTVRGQEVVPGDKAFVQSNQIQGPAPNLPVFEFEI